LHDRQGTRFTIGFGAANLRAGKHLDATDATWDGEDRLELRSKLNTARPDGAVSGTATIDARTGSGDPAEILTFELHRANKQAFDTVC
jgi:hypothetical protein